MNNSSLAPQDAAPYNHDMDATRMLLRNGEDETQRSDDVTLDMDVSIVGRVAPLTTYSEDTSPFLSPRASDLSNSALQTPLASSSHYPLNEQLSLVDLVTPKIGAATTNGINNNLTMDACSSGDESDVEDEAEESQSQRHNLQEKKHRHRRKSILRSTTDSNSTANQHHLQHQHHRHNHSNGNNRQEPANPESTNKDMRPRSVSSVAKESNETIEDDYLQIESMTGYQPSFLRKTLFFISSIFSVGMIALFSRWWPSTFIGWQHIQVPIRNASHVYIVGSQHGTDLVKVQPMVVETDAEKKVRLRHDSLQQKSTHAESSSTAPFFRIDEPIESDTKSLLHPSLGSLTVSFRKEAETPLLSSDESSITHSSPSQVVTSSTRAVPLMVVWRHMRFVMHPATQSYERICAPRALGSSELHALLKFGLSFNAVRDRQLWYGLNAICLPVPSYWSLLVNEVFHPFYVFQIYSVILWCFELYYIFAAAIALIATVSIVTTLLETRNRIRALSDIAYHVETVTVLRNGNFVKISSAEVVPGDVIQVTTGIVPCDITLLDGGCVVNESMLTGESVPVIKGDIEWPLDRATSHHHIPLGIDQRTTVFASTKVLQVKPTTPDSFVLGVVVRTGFATTKGNLILSILYPKPSSFTFVQQSYKFIGVLFAVAMIGFGITIWQLLDKADAAVSTIIIRACDLVTIVVPPSLPLALAVGTNFALIALRKKNIYCISPSRINMGGKIKVFCFDKTGTLTSDSLEFVGVLPSMTGHFSAFQNKIIDLHPPQLQESKPLTSPNGTHLILINGEGDSSSDSDTSPGPSSPLPILEPYQSTQDLHVSSSMVIAMASCQQLAVLEGNLIGDPLEIEIFNATGARLIDTGAELSRLQLLSIVQVNVMHGSKPQLFEFGVVAQFEFNSALQRMSVVTRSLNSTAEGYAAYVKGSPEMIQTLCNPMTIPPDFQSVLAAYTRDGYRVLAIASKPVEKLPSLEKDEMRRYIEKDLTFMGLIMLENKVKPESEPAISKLRHALIRCVMVTGDNPLTAVTVAKECKLVNPGTLIFQSQIKKLSSGETDVEWRCTTDESVTLDPSTLGPQQAINSSFELAVTGPAFHLLQERAHKSISDRKHFQKVLLAGQVFARMTPNQKAALISEMMGMGLHVGMVGDGSNDSIALKTAHVGISLSDSEASIAAPFTYSRPNISCVPILLSEGRASLITSFQLFKYMAMYSMIQFGSVILTYFRGSVFGNWQYLWQDLYTVFPLTIFMGDTKANSSLSIKRPSGNLLSVSNVLRTLVHIFICLGFEVLVFFRTEALPGYVLPDNPNHGPDSWETTSLYYFSNFQYLIMAALFVLGYPWKANPLSNYKFTIWWIIVLASDLVLVLVNHQFGFWRSDDLHLASAWRQEIVILALINFAICIIWDQVIFPIALRFSKKLQFVNTENVSSFYGLRKNGFGLDSKVYHRLRGEFEQHWYNNRGDIHLSSKPLR